MVVRRFNIQSPIKGLAFQYTLIQWQSSTAPTAATLSTGVAVAITFIVSTILGFLAGLLVMYSLMRRKGVYSTKTTTLSVVGPTAPAGPVYEEVSPKEEIELNTNQAYGPVGLWNFC